MIREKPKGKERHEREERGTKHWIPKGGGHVKTFRHPLRQRPHDRESGHRRSTAHHDVSEAWGRLRRFQGSPGMAPVNQLLCPKALPWPASAWRRQRSPGWTSARVVSTSAFAVRLEYVQVCGTWAVARRGHPNGVVDEICQG